MPKQKTYLIAIVPSHSICLEVFKYKEDLANRFKSFSALKSVPHITLKRPFQFSSSDESLMNWFTKLDLNLNSFSQELKNFSFFENKNDLVIYIKPIRNLKIITLQRYLLSKFEATYSNAFTTQYDLCYQPHLTIAHCDLSPDFFKIAWNEYRDIRFKGSFLVNEIHLLELHLNNWIIRHSLPFNVSKHTFMDSDKSNSELGNFTKKKGLNYSQLAIR